MSAVRSYRTQLARVRGLGSAKEGVQHWWAQRLTALALVPLGLWFVASVVALIGADHAAVAAWLASPVTLGLMILLVAAAFHHMQLGLQVVVEDYVQSEGVRLALIVALKAASLLLALAAVIALLRVAFGT
jgi:succinate dehydrogenase / fumarate reductase membrane anchor subunit